MDKETINAIVNIAKDVHAITKEEKIEAKYHEFIESFLRESSDIRDVLLVMILILEKPSEIINGRIQHSLAEELEYNLKLEISGGILSKNFDEYGCPINELGDFLFAFKEFVSEFILAKSKYDNDIIKEE